MVDGIRHKVEYTENMNGSAPLSIDGVPQYHPFSFQAAGIGTFCAFKIGVSKFILKVSKDSLAHDLAQDGVYLSDESAVESQVQEAYQREMDSAKAQDAEEAEYVKHNKSGMTSFLTFVLLTLVNLLLASFNATISFPYSASFPSLLMAIHVNLNPQTPLFFFAAYGIGGLFAPLYALGRKRNWPLAVAFGMMILDYLLVIFLSIGDISSMLVNLLFGAWVLLSMGRLVILRFSKAKRDKDKALTTTWGS